MSEVKDVARQERREADRRKSREAVEALRGSEGWQHWLAARRYFRRYSLANQLLIAMQMPEATMVCGFRAWLKLGYCVRRGETALRIWIPMGPSRTEMERWQAAGALAADKPRTRFRLRPVFDRSQVAPLPPPADPKPLDPPIVSMTGFELAWAWWPLTDLAVELGCEVRVERMPEHQGGCYVPATRWILINRTKSANHRVKTLVHELGHALLRLEPPDGELSLSYSEEELVVESIAYTVCGSLGLDTTGYSIPYLASWSEGAGLETIELAAKTIHRIAKRIEGAVITDS